MTTKNKRAQPPAEAQPPTDQVALLRTIATDKRKIKDLNAARGRLDTAIKAIRVRITENETAVYQPYEPTESQPTEEMFRQLELF